MGKRIEKWGYAASGGGAKGAWGGGVSQYLTEELGRDYEVLAGTSTGNLLMNLVALKRMALLKEAYTGVNNDDIYDLAPYRIASVKNGVFKTKMNYFKIGWNIFVKKQVTFGDSTKLRRELIPKFFTKKDYEEVLSLNKELISCVVNLTLARHETKSNMDDKMTYEDFLDWVWASTCAAPYMSVVNKNNMEYVDGGYIEHIPIQSLIDRGCTHIDVISHSAPKLDTEKMRDPLHLIRRLMDISMKGNAEADMLVANLQASEHDVVINYYEPGRKLTNNSLVFDKQTMIEWWKEGYDYAKNMKCTSYCINKDGSTKLGHVHKH